MTTDRETAVQLEREIGQTRADIDSTLTAIQERLSPGRLLDKVLDYTKDNGGAFAGNLGRSVRDNPVPAALLGIGLGWLMLAGRNRNGMPGDYAGEPNYGFPVAGDAGFIEGGGPAASAESVGERSSSLMEAGKEKASGLAADARQAASAAGQRVAAMRHETSHAAERVKDRAQHATASAAHFIEENPLIVGALAVAAGAALGALVPTTRREGEIMGAASNRVKEAIGSGMSELAAAAKTGAAPNPSGDGNPPPARTAEETSIAPHAATHAPAAAPTGLKAR